jgi:hypothetical protein
MRNEFKASLGRALASNAHGPGFDVAIVALVEKEAQELYIISDTGKQIITHTVLVV